MENDDVIDWGEAFDEELLEHVSSTSVNNIYGEKIVGKPAKRQRKEVRKFPGPAGILPRITVGAGQSASNLAKIRPSDDGEQEENGDHLADNSFISQELPTQAELTDENLAWKEASRDQPNFDELISKFNIAQIEQKAKSEGTSLKTPLLIAAIKTIDLSSGMDPECELQDKTGSTSGMIHRVVIENYGQHIRPGTVLVLKNISVIVSKGVAHVNITRNNIASFYCGGSGSSAGVTTERICQLTREDIMRAAAKFERQFRVMTASQPASSPRLLSTISLRAFRPPAASSPSVNRINNSNSPLQRPPHSFPTNVTVRSPTPSPIFRENSPQTEEILDGLDEESIFGDF